MTHPQILNLFINGDLAHANNTTEEANYRSICQTAFFPLFQDDFTKTVQLLVSALDEIQQINCIALDQVRRGGCLDDESHTMTYKTKTAEVSPCGQYRYRLGRLWDERLPICLWVMLNPSTADACIDDQTIRRCVDYSVRWGYGGLLVGNLFGWQATEPEELYQAENPVGPENDRHLQAMLAEAGLVVCAWGIHGSYRGRDREVMEMLNGRGHALVVTKGGHPGHPVRRPKTDRPIPYSGQSWAGLSTEVDPKIRTGG